MVFFTPPLQGRGRGWGLLHAGRHPNIPHPNPSREGEGFKAGAP
jgi:hypothetical protein